MTTTTRANEAHDHPVQGKRTGSGGIAHTHEFTAPDPSAAIAAAIAAHEAKPAEVTQAEFDALAARVTALENEPEPPDPPVPPTTVTVASITALETALANDANTDITLAPGTYSGRLYFDSRFAARTKPCVIRLAGVTFNGGGLTFRGGAHDLEVLDPTFANWAPSDTGVIMFGGWDEAAAHHITVRRPKILASVKRTREGNTTEHGVYFSIAQGGIHDVLIEDLSVDATDPMGLATAIHADHGDSTKTAHDITCRRTVFKGNGTQGSSVQYALILWLPPYRNWLFDGGTITNANGSAIRVQSTTSTNIVFKDIVSTGSRYGGLYGGANPPGVTFTNCSLG